MLDHTGNNSFNRNFNYAPFSTGNLLNSVAVGSSTYNFSYDACGNMLTENSSRIFEWDAVDRLRSFRIEASGNITKYTHYLYDAGGKRVKKLVWTQGGNYDSYTYIDGVFEYRTDGAKTQNLLHVMDSQSRIAMRRIGDAFGDSTPDIQYNVENHLGSSLIILDSGGSDINQEEYYPFGETSFGSYALKRYRYVGKERDAESGLYYYGARYYSAWTCRFISVDPLAAKYNQLTPYQNAGNNPINDYDIDGMQGVKTPEGGDKGGNNTNVGNAQATNPTITAVGTTGVTATYSPPAATSPTVLDECSGNCQTIRGPVVDGGGYNVDIPADATTLTGKQVYSIAGKPDNKVDVTFAFSYTDDKGVLKMFQWSPEVNAFYSSQSNEIYGGKGVAIANGYMSSAKIGGVISPSWFGASWNSGGSQSHPSYGTGQGVYTAQTIAAGFVPVNFGINFAASGISAEGAVWAQNTFSGTFSAGGKFAGQTVDEVAAALESGTLSASEVPINVIVRNGQTFILNTRSSAALTMAGIPRSAWNVINQTGVASFESMLTGQLTRNGLVEGVRIIRSGAR